MSTLTPQARMFYQQFQMGQVFLSRRQYAEAAECFRQCLRWQADHAEARRFLSHALHAFGVANMEQGNLTEATALFRELAALQPQDAEAHNLLGITFAQQGLLTKAAESTRRAVALDPNYAHAHANLANILVGQESFAEAGQVFERALVLDPGNKVALWNQALLRLRQGDYLGAWAGFEERWSAAGVSPHTFGRPRWDGSPLAGRTLLVHAELGLGDSIQFLRFVPLVARSGGTIVLEVQAPLLELCQSSFRAAGPEVGDVRIIPFGSDIPSFDRQIPLGSLPGVLGTTLATIPATVPYLHPDQALCEAWRRQLSSLPGLKVGLAWQGNPAFPGDRFRSFPLSHFERLALVPGVSFVSLQKGIGIEQLRSRAPSFPILDLSPSLTTFHDTAAVMKNLDLVISSDTSVPHLAGALGVPVWVALAKVPCWRYLIDRADSPWYPTMRLFRQTQQGAWEEVFERMKEALQKFL